SAPMKPAHAMMKRPSGHCVVNAKAASAIMRTVTRMRRITPTGESNRAASGTRKTCRDSAGVASAAAAVAAMVSITEYSTILARLNFVHARAGARLRPNHLLHGGRFAYGVVDGARSRRRIAVR